MKLGSLFLPAYTRPTDGTSKPDFEAQKVLRPLTRAVHHFMIRQDVRGRENFPEEGPHVYCPTHQSGIDPGLIMGLSDRDMRFMAAEDQLQEWYGPLLERMGAFPVDREKPSLTTLKQSVAVLKNEKAGLGIFPAGGIPGDGRDGKVGEFKDGPGWIAVRGKAKSVVPITMHIAPDEKIRPGERTLAFLAATGLTALGVLGAGAGPVTRSIVGLAGGALTGAFLGSRFGGTPTAGQEWNPYPTFQTQVVNGLKGMVLGAAAGVAGANLLPIPFVAEAAALAGGASTFGLATDYIHRPVAKIQIDPGLNVQAYVDEYGLKNAGDRLMEDLHTHMAETKDRLVFFDR